MELTSADVERYRSDGFVVVNNVFGADEIEALNAVTDELIAAARGIAAHDDVYDLEDDHRPDAPRVRRIKAPHLRHEVYRAAAINPVLLGLLRPLLGEAIRFDESKLNVKSAGGGAAVEWHQDWAFYPATNDDLCTVGVMLSDCSLENGPLLVVPGSHRGPVYDHHAGGRFCGAIDGRHGSDFASARPCTGPAGSVSIHHVRAVHGSACNRSGQARRLLLFAYRAADAWPLLPQAGFEAGSFADSMSTNLVSGDADPAVPRLAEVPVRLPLPGPEHVGSIFENQRGAITRAIRGERQA